MSSKLGLILSMFFVALTFLFGGDLISIQAAYTSLQSDANDISYYLMKYGYNERTFDDFFLENYGQKGLEYVIDELEGNNDGDLITYSLQGKLNLFLISSSLSLSVTRTTIIGYYVY